MSPSDENRSAGSRGAKHPPVYQCAPVNALVEGIYRERVPLRKILEHGDFGIGTFDDLDGEMVILDGRVYQIAGTGVVREVTQPVATPFACVTFWTPAAHDDLAAPCGYDAFLDWLLTLLPSPNLFYALRVEGLFDEVHTRSVPRQESYRPLVEVAAHQPEFSFSGARGTLAGFYTPAFMESVNVPGLHLHFLSDDRTQGGHLLACSPHRVRASVQFIHTLELGLPMNLDYLTWDFRRDTGADLGRAEK
jgi:acetolactate decarboxylase